MATGMMDPRRMSLLDQFQLSKSMTIIQPMTLFNEEPNMDFFENFMQPDGQLTSEDEDISTLNSPLLTTPLDDLTHVETRRDSMKPFAPEKVENFKHVIYNLLVDSYNSKNPEQCLVSSCTISIDGVERTGFQFNEKLDPEKKLPELYAFHIRHSRLDLENQDSIFIQDLYKFYLRYALELLGKYFEKAPISIGKWVFLCQSESPLFVPGSSLREAEERIKKMKTRARKREKASEPKVSKRKRS